MCVFVSAVICIYSMRPTGRTSSQCPGVSVLSWNNCLIDSHGLQTHTTATLNTSQLIIEKKNKSHRRAAKCWVMSNLKENIWMGWTASSCLCFRKDLTLSFDFNRDHSFLSTLEERLIWMNDRIYIGYIYKDTHINRKMNTEGGIPQKWKNAVHHLVSDSETLPRQIIWLCDIA